MSLSRRHVILAGLGLAVTGCATTAATSRSGSTRPEPIWPEDVKRPTPGATRVPDAPVAARPVETTRAPVASSSLPAGVLPRKNWTRHGITSRNITAMNGVKKITIHHEGWVAFTSTSAAATYDRIEKIRQVHTRDRGWADIGYHFVIDRKGRVIEGRPLRYQGAHVSENNPHNLGILVLGNFEKQKPTAEQVAALGRFTRQMMKQHRVAATNVRTHREINPTECPGRYLQAHIDKLRKARTIA